ncbi:amylosucrase [Aestuariibacter halophilus]|uniref:Amylosucrase n=1 Tax=Fluctibacter halophilus TaxID=226011 RepID=A0ABS8GD10_9ALTE|nr:alpha-amylase family glycosyl hydrolase [Aestuariibacter halophilus]MCC2617745.1 amylosucrase [Aestuariibacter halophilus]
MNVGKESSVTLQRIVNNLDWQGLNPSQRRTFEQRLNAHFPRLFGLLLDIYPSRYDLHFHCEDLVQRLLRGFLQRNNRLKALDKQRLKDPHWYKSQDRVGMSCYVDLFAGDLQRLKARIPYLQAWGINYLHLMPLYAVPEGDSDGGYAVSDYRRVNPALGDIDDLRALAKALEDAGISLVLDFVFNHTADNHPWALAAQQGDPVYQDYYYLFDDKTVPDQYEHHLREIFPQVRRGNFTWNDAAQKWVWTTFNSFQWDLNYTNPEVFKAITEEMLFLANIGCEGLRLDALAFIWKEMGTDCENQPNAHKLIQAFNCCLQIAAPAVVFKSEAIVHPDEVVKYIDAEECQLSYNPLLMALLWNSLATRKTRLLTASMQKSFAISPDCAWVNYVRCHDDIGWTFDDDVAASLGINGTDHRHFLNQFYTGRFEGSFATGVAFADNPQTGDCRVCGSMASLAGLEQAIEKDDPALIELAVKRILLLHAVTFAIGGIPVLYSGDELGLLNDYSYQSDPDKRHDDRWVHRVALTDDIIDASLHGTNPHHGIVDSLQHMLSVRRRHAIFGEGATDILTPYNDHVFAVARHLNNQHLVALFNFSEQTQSLDGRILEALGPKAAGDDLLTGKHYQASDALSIPPYGVVWIGANLDGN